MLEDLPGSRSCCCSLARAVFILDERRVQQTHSRAKKRTSGLDSAAELDSFSELHYKDRLSVKRQLQEELQLHDEVLVLEDTELDLRAVKLLDEE